MTAEIYDFEAHHQRQSEARRNREEAFSRELAASSRRARRRALLGRGAVLVVTIGAALAAYFIGGAP